MQVCVELFAEGRDLGARGHNRTIVCIAEKVDACGGEGNVRHVNIE